MRHSRKSLRRRQTVLIEACEKRVVFDATYHNLAGGPLIQSWTNTSQITTADIWDGVPSIIGYQGADPNSTASPVDPRTMLQPRISASDTPVGVPDVNANQTNPDTFFSGGVTEFHLTDPVVALTGSNTADAPFLLLHLNTTGQTNIPMSFRIRDIETADNAVQPVTVQYRIGDTGNFTDLSTTIPAVYVSDATTTGLGPDIPISFTLPAALENQAMLQIRIITGNAAGNDEWIGIDDINVGGGTVPTTMQFASPSRVLRETDGTISVEVTRTGSSTSAASVLVNSTGGNATPGSDYAAIVNELVQFGVGETSKLVNLGIINDTDLENAETVVLSLSSATGGTIGVPVSTTVTIADDDSSTPANVVLNEIKLVAPGNDNPYEYVEIKGPAGTILRNVYLVAWEGTVPASSGTADYVFDLSGATIGSNGLLIIRGASGHASGGTTVLTDTRLDNNDTFESDSATFGLYFSPAPLVQATDYDIDNDGAQDWGTLLPSLPTPTTMDSVGWMDGGDSADVVYSSAVVVLSGSATDNPDAVTRFRTNSTANDTNAWYGGNLVGTNDTVAYDNAAGSLTANFPAGGILTPGGENAPSGAGLLTFSQNPYSVNESTSSITITVNRTGGSTGTATVQYATADVTAFAGQDYIAASGTLTFLNGETSKTFNVTILNESLYEGTEAFNVVLSNATGAGLGATTSVVNIENDDATVQPNVLLNEINVDPPSTDEGYEYVEVISNSSAQTLGNVYFVTIEGDNNTNIAKVTFVQSLTGYSTGSNKLAMIKSLEALSHSAIEGATTIVPSPTMTGVGALQGGGNSFLLIFSPDAPITLTQQLGAIDGSLPLLPANAVVLDAIGWKGAQENATDDVVFGGVDLSFASPSNSNIPAAATRIFGDAAALNASSWYYGRLAGSANTGLAYGTPASANLPSGAALTPGGANVADGIAPTVSSVVFDKLTSGQAPSITVTFSEAVTGITLSDAGTSSFTITDRSTNTAIPASNFTLTPVSTSVYKITFTGANGAPADGDFKITVNAANVKDLANNPMAANTSQNYSFLQGDIDSNTGDRKVNTVDFNVLAANFGGSSKNFAQGDLNFNGSVDSTDFGIFVAQYGKSLAAVPPPAPLAVASQGIFGTSTINGDLIETVLA
jgi:hypothetical protein